MPVFGRFPIANTSGYLKHPMAQRPPPLNPLLHLAFKEGQGDDSSWSAGYRFRGNAVKKGL